MSVFTVYNPITGEPCGEFPVADASEVACGLTRAREAARDWAALSVEKRCKALAHLADLLAEEADSLCKTVAQEIGKPLQEAYGADLLPSLDALCWLIQVAPRRLREQPLPGAKSVLRFPAPYGVVGVIGTWNYPLYLNITPIAWALAAGNAILWKPSELATASAQALARLFTNAGLPVVTLVGDGTTGRELCRAGCDKVVFTGGVATGRAILAELAARGIPSVMELSGNDAFLVCEDANIPLAARSAVWGRCCNAGQSCVAPQRIYVLSAVYKAFLSACQREMEGLRAEQDYGPLRTEALRTQAHRYVSEAITGGACLLYGGYRLDGRPGFFYAPTLLADCVSSLRVMRQDFFGPVLAVSPVTSENEAIDRVNSDSMALSASVWSRDKRRAGWIAKRLNVGLVSINDVLLDAARPELPFGGQRASGFGKQRGLAGLDEIVQWRIIAAHPAGGTRRHLFPYRNATIPILRGLVAWRLARSVQAKFLAARELANAAQAWEIENQTVNSGLSQETNWQESG